MDPHPPPPSSSSNSSPVKKKSKMVDMEMEQESEKKEREHFKRVVKAFQDYKKDSRERLDRKIENLSKISLEQQRTLERLGYQKSLKALETCINLNDGVIRDVIADVSTMFMNASENEEEEDPNFRLDSDSGGKVAPKRRGGGSGTHTGTRLEDHEKVQSTLKQFVRDWSRDGAKERGQCHGPILEELKRVFPDPKDIKVLVPGAGLGRLAFDIATLGFECQGNEFSLFMLIASNFVLNKSRERDCFTIYPWIHQFTNQLSSENMTREVTFPDVDPNCLSENAKFSMTAGDFLEVYSNPEYEGALDCVATCFFIDCAHNILDFILLIARVLKRGGRWINFGPLLYHFADMPKEWSIEPSYEIVKNLITQSGFSFEKELTHQPATYCQNPKSMLQYEYQCVFFSCVKNADGSSS